MKFYGRDLQKKNLKRVFERNELQTVLVYGRRRVGKSELIKQSLRETDIRSIYYECKQTTEMNNTDSLSLVISELFQIPKPHFSDMEELLDYLFRAASGLPLIVVLDEYPYLREAVKGLDSILQSLIDKYRESSLIKFIVCGSYVDVMKSLIFRRKSPVWQS